MSHSGCSTTSAHYGGPRGHGRSASRLAPGPAVRSSAGTLLWDGGFLKLGPPVSTAPEMSGSHFVPGAPLTTPALSLCSCPMLAFFLPRGLCRLVPLPENFLIPTVTCWAFCRHFCHLQSHLPYRPSHGDLLSHRSLLTSHHSLCCVYSSILPLRSGPVKCLHACLPFACLLACSLLST